MLSLRRQCGQWLFWNRCRLCSGFCGNGLGTLERWPASRWSANWLGCGRCWTLGASLNLQQYWSLRCTGTGYLGTPCVPSLRTARTNWWFPSAPCKSSLYAVATVSLWACAQKQLRPPHHCPLCFCSWQMWGSSTVFEYRASPPSAGSFASWQPDSAAASQVCPGKILLMISFII